MKIFIKLLCFVVILGLVGPFIMRAPNGQPYMDYRKLIPSLSGAQNSMKRWWNNDDAEHQSAEEKIQSNETSTNSWGKTRIYRWQDENGVWQYTDKPPTNVNVETLWLNPNENIVASQPVSTVSEIAETEANAAKQPGFELPLPLTVAPSEVPQLFEDAQQLRELMQQRNEKLESISGESRQ